MRLVKNKSAMLLAGLACMLISVAANSSPIDLTRAASDGWMHGHQTVSITPGGNVYAGEFKFGVVSGNDDFETGSTLGLFCIDVTTSLNNNASYTVVGASGHLSAVTFGKVAWLYDNHYENANSAIKSAAFQLALWTIVNGVTVNSAPHAVISAMTTMLSGLGSISNSALYDIFVFTPQSGQVLIGVKPVPEPGSLMLLGLGVLGAGAVRRIRKH